MAQLFFTRNAPRRVFALFESPLSEHRQSRESTSIEAAIWLARSRFVHEKGIFWSGSNEPRSGLDAVPVVFRRLIRRLLQCMISLSANQKI
jgi:hypothetical protein